jgi:hypothetical protein
MAMLMVFFVMDHVVVIGCDPEQADMGNPRGEVHRLRFFVVGEEMDGSRVAYAGREWDSLEAAQRFADKVEAAVARGAALDPELWQDMDPCYGSQAYVAGGYEEMAAQREREDAGAWGW